MSEKPINDVLAANLVCLMKEQGFTQKALADKCGLNQTTISLYLTPSRRMTGSLGKAPSAKLSEVELLAKCFGVEIWQLLRPLNPEQRIAYAAIEVAYKALQPKQIQNNQGEK